jgi:hypothetical protein
MTLSGRTSPGTCHAGQQKRVCREESLTRGPKRKKNHANLNPFKDFWMQEGLLLRDLSVKKLGIRKRELSEWSDERAPTFVKEQYGS